KDLKTSLGYLAQALGQGSPDQATLDAACHDPDAWLPTLDTHFATLTAQGRVISAVTQRNTRSNLRLVFKLAETHGLLPAALPARLPSKTTRKEFLRQRRGTTPYPSTYTKQGHTPYLLLYPQWPEDIMQGWQDYQVRCGLRLRESTFATYRGLLESYVGYLT